jgi:Na+/phosphate symporter
MLTALLPALICLAGLVVYVLAANPKAAEIGRLMFGCGLLVVCLVLAGRMVRLL